MVVVVVLDVLPVFRSQVGLGQKGHVANDECLLRIVVFGASVRGLGGE